MSVSSPWVENVFDNIQKTAKGVKEMIILTSSFITWLKSLIYFIKVVMLSLIFAAATPINTENISKWIIFPSASDLKILLGKKLMSLLKFSVDILLSMLSNNIGS